MLRDMNHDDVFDAAAAVFSSHTGHVMAGAISRKHICSFFLYTYTFSFVFPIFVLCFCWRSNEGFYYVICVAVAGIRWDTSLISTSMDAFMKGASRPLFSFSSVFYSSPNFPFF